MIHIAIYGKGYTYFGDHDLNREDLNSIERNNGSPKPNQVSPYIKFINGW